MWDQTAVDVATSGYVRASPSAGVSSPGSCALNEDGVVYCWGEAMLQAFDSGVTSKASQLPQRVRSVPEFVRIESGAGKTCGITATEDLYCWGRFIYGMFTLGEIPVQSVTDIASSERHACALTREGKRHCWGYDSWGEIGDTATEHSFKRIAAGLNFTCALDNEGFAYCWGRNHMGQLGRGDTTLECGWGKCPDTDVSPQRVATDIRFTDIGAGMSHACALSVDGLVYCWGDGAFGQLGNRTTQLRTEPVVVALQDPLRFEQFVVGSQHTCGVATDGKIYCWGRGDLGQLGTGSTDHHNKPAVVWGQ